MHHKYQIVKSQQTVIKTIDSLPRQILIGCVLRFRLCELIHIPCNLFFKNCNVKAKPLNNISSQHKWVNSLFHKCYKYLTADG